VEFIILFLGLGVSGCLLYLGFAPNGARWWLGLGLLGAALAGAVRWWLASTLPPGGIFNSSTYTAIVLAFTLTALIGVGLVITLRGERRLAALGLGIFLPLVVGQVVYATADQRYGAQRLTTLQANLDRNMALWKANRPFHYRFTLHRAQFCAPGYCPPPETAEVRGSNSTSLTVEKLYAVIQTGIDQNDDIIDVDYDPKLGYPRQIDTTPDRLISDQGVILTLADFQILP